MSSSSVDIETCGICKKHFNQDDRKPKFLHCYHTYCVKCLTNIQEEVTVISALYMSTDSHILDDTKG
jgi:Zinc finger, C3HC4 type (RING finger).